MTFDVKAFIVGEHSKFGGYEEIRPVEDAMLLGPGLLGYLYVQSVRSFCTVHTMTSLSTSAKQLGHPQHNA